MKKLLTALGIVCALMAGCSERAQSVSEATLKNGPAIAPDFHQRPTQDIIPGEPLSKHGRPCSQLCAGVDPGMCRVIQASNGC